MPMNQIHVASAPFLPVFESSKAYQVVICSLQKWKSLDKLEEFAPQQSPFHHLEENCSSSPTISSSDRHSNHEVSPTKHQQSHNFSFMKKKMHNFLLNFKNGLFTDTAHNVYVTSTST